MAGVIALAGTLFFSLCAVLCYAVPFGKAARWGRILTGLSFLCTAAASMILLQLILGNRFDIAYVVSYSSLNLPLMYKVSAFWAGQQGSFLLWLFIHAMVGCILSVRHRLADSGMLVYQLLQSLLTMLVLAKSPFLPLEDVVQNGAGLNPLLQDPWMAIHPPVVFVGYALLAVPLAYSASALLMKRPGTEWLESARKWALLGWSFLGAGIFMGGYWAYKVLGWGGYWGWDPVENSSLVPWLAVTIFVHVLHVARVRAAAISLVYLAAVFAFSLVLYGTFLTRSGILGDFSVHSFSGTSIGLTIAVVNAVVLISGLLLLLFRANRLPTGNLYTSHNSREFFVLLGMLLLVFIAILVFLGMSMPLLTKLLNKPAAVDPVFYVRTTMPLAVAFTIVLACSCLRFSDRCHLRSRVFLLLPFFLSGAAVALWVGVREVLPIVLAGTSALAAGSSVFSWRHKALGIGGMLAHVGVGAALLAMVLAGNGSQSVTREFIVGEPVVLLGHEIGYHGQVFETDGTAKYYRYTVDGHVIQALTKLHANGEDAAREPAIDRTLSGDVYIAPIPGKNTERIEQILKLGTVKMDDLFAYRYENATEQKQPDGTVLVTADIGVTDGTTVEHVQPTIVATMDGGTSQPTSVFGGKKRIRLTGVSSDQRQIRVELLPSEEEAAGKPVIALVSIKPYIWLLWLGCLLTTAGCLIAIKK